MWLATKKESVGKDFNKETLTFLNQMAKGCYGFMLAFHTEEDALRYAGGTGKVIEVKE